MSELENLIFRLRTCSTDVAYARNEGSGSVPVHYVDDLVDAATALVAHLDEVAEASTQSIVQITPVPDQPWPAARVGDVIGPNAKDIPVDVLEFVNEEGDTWRRPVDQAEATHEGQVYDWVTVGGWATTEGQISYYAPLRVTKVRNDEV